MGKLLERFRNVFCRFVYHNAGSSSVGSWENDEIDCDYTRTSARNIGKFDECGDFVEVEDEAWVIKKI